MKHRNDPCVSVSVCKCVSVRVCVGEYVCVLGVFQTARSTTE